MSEAIYFKKFCDDLLIGTTKRSLIATRYNTICTRLNKSFWNVDITSGGKYIGSFGRNTANGWVSDIDMLFEMPLSSYNTYSAYMGNGQSAFLQTVKNAISLTYPSTTLKGDGQIVLVQFADGMKFEVLPAFKQSNGSFIFADSNSGGSWKNTNPVPEISAIATGDVITNYNLRHLCRMARAWKNYCNVPIKSLLIDTLAHRFLINWAYKSNSYLYYDWMSRDFFEYLKNQISTQTVWYAVGSNQPIDNPDNFRFKATVAYNRAIEAIELQSDKKEWSAKQKWREIYGTRFPD